MTARSLALCLVLVPATSSADWRPVPGKPMTRWAKDVKPETPLPEYPRPQLVREKWQNLNGLWDYAITAKGAAKPDKWDGQILVPFCAESALSGVGKHPTKDQHLWYHRAVEVHVRTRVHFQGAIAGEAGVAAQPVGAGNVVHALQHEADEAIALAPDARHHRAAVHLDSAVQAQAELAPLVRHVSGVPGSDQQLAGHATDAGAGGAVGPALDDDCTLAGRHGRAVGREAGGSGADHGDIDMHGAHSCECS